MTRSRTHQAAGQRRFAPPGFTLVELVVVLAIVAILSAVAWPGYGSVLQRAHRGEARQALLRLQHMQEVHYATHLRYAQRLGDSADSTTLHAGDRSENGSYLLSMRASEDGQRFTALARATPDGRQARDIKCQWLSVDETGQRRSADALENWVEAGAGGCWE